MDAIRNYLESMFMNMPNTPEVLKAKAELGQMMEDKYNELISEGKPENEAVGIVISEFGNLNEIAGDLGISGYIKPEFNLNRRKVSYDEAKDFIKDKAKQSYMVALGVLLCIMSPVGCIIAGTVTGPVSESAGIILLFTFIAVAVGIFIFSGMIMHRWSFLERDVCSIDFATAEFVNNQFEANRITHALLVTVGVVLCIVSVLPAAVIGEFSNGTDYIMDNISGALLFVFIGVGVFLIIIGSMRKRSYEILLKLNAGGTVGGNFVPSQKEEHYSSRTAEAVMQIYWPTMTCIYLCWSFMTFDWHISWIIWPVAGVVHMLLKNIFAGR